MRVVRVEWQLICYSTLTYQQAEISVMKIS